MKMQDIYILGKKIFAIRISDKGLISRILKGPYKLIRKRQPNRKMGKRLEWAHH